jgi:hypothetical protein
MKLLQIKHQHTCNSHIRNKNIHKVSQAKKTGPEKFRAGLQL